MRERIEWPTTPPTAPPLLETVNLPKETESESHTSAFATTPLAILGITGYEIAYNASNQRYFWFGIATFIYGSMKYAAQFGSDEPLIKSPKS